ncbi:toll/interleukin-1 receptor domain-containing protein [Chloroflexota bacterium]
MADDNPKLFISYSWSSPEHQQWVIDLATQLREYGVDVVLDKWALKEGHDAIAFMEKWFLTQILRR